MTVTLYRKMPAVKLFYFPNVSLLLAAFRAALAELAGMEGGDAVGGGGGEELVSSLSATPHYNSAILEDMCMKEHLAALHDMCGDSEAFRDAIILGKVHYCRVARLLKP